MRLITFLLATFLVSSPLLSQRLSRDDAKTRLMEFLEQYSPDSHDMMVRLSQLGNQYKIGSSQITLSPEQSPLTWVRERTEKGIIESLNTVVHECMHGFTSRYAFQMLEENPPADYEFGQDYSVFYISPDEMYLVKHSDVFTSNKLKQEIPKPLRTFRYNPYIAPRDNNLGSQIQGIYGLMDEWNAYYHGTRTAYDLFDYYKNKAQDKDKKVYLDHVSNLAGTYFAYYEFKYYILKYLEMARQDYPDRYQELMDNTEMRKAYTAIDDRFTALVDLFEERLDTIETLVTSDNYTSVYRQDGFYFIGSNGVGIFSDEANLLKKELETDALKRLDQAIRIQ